MASLMHLPKPETTYGEIFLASSMEGAQCTVDGQAFDEFYRTHPDFFRLNSERFPLRVNLIDTSSPLSIQVHPGSEITGKLGYPQGVHEFWFVLEAESNSTIVLGHRFEDLKTLKTVLRQNQIRAYCPDRPVHEGDFFHLYPGTMHAIGSRLLVYELTYNLDLTYRVHDYDRIDPKTGMKRTLHVKDALSAITFPQRFSCGAIENKPVDGFEETTLVDEPGIFTLNQWRINDDVTIPIESFQMCTVIRGAGWIDDQPVRQYETVLVPATATTLRMIGEMTILAASYRE